MPGTQITLGGGATSQTLSSSSTITVNAGLNLVTSSSDVTGIIVQAGKFDAQPLVIINTGSNVITMAASGTSNVADGTSDIITASQTAMYTWSGIQNLWYRVDGNTGQRNTSPAPNDFGWKTWTCDPLVCNTTNLLATGSIYLMAVFVRSAMTISNVIYNVTTVGATLTSAENFIGLYNSSGTRVALTADQTTNFQTSGIHTAAFTSSYAATPGMYYIAIVSNGTTPPTLRASAGLSSTLLANAGLSAASYRSAINGTGTTLPSSLTLSSNTQANAASICFILS